MRVLDATFPGMEIQMTNANLPTSGVISVSNELDKFRNIIGKDVSFDLYTDRYTNRYYKINAFCEIKPYVPVTSRENSPVTGEGFFLVVTYEEELEKGMLVSRTKTSLHHEGWQMDGVEVELLEDLEYLF
ncbi:MAG: hypothetical protein RBR08_15135 [Desulforegulaceae bacterium]|nr:hypothetical protein [Desulforegulaceae bacterium]